MPKRSGVDPDKNLGRGGGHGFTNIGGPESLITKDQKRYTRNADYYRAVRDSDRPTIGNFPYLAKSSTSPGQDKSMAFLQTLNGDGRSMEAPQWNINLTEDMLRYYKQKEADKERDLLHQAKLARLKGLDPLTRRKYLEMDPELMAGYNAAIENRVDLDVRLTDLQNFGPMTDEDFGLLMAIASGAVKLPTSPVWKKDGKDPNKKGGRGILNLLRWTRGPSAVPASDAANIAEFLKDLPGFNADTFTEILEQTKISNMPDKFKGLF